MPQECTKLSKYHKEKIVPIVVQIFNYDHGIVTNAEIRAIVYDATGHVVDPCKIRGVIHEIRRLGLVKNIIACSKGYRVARNVVEVQKYLSELQSRAMAIHNIQSALKKQAEETFGQQLNIC